MSLQHAGSPIEKGISVTKLCVEIWRGKVPLQLNGLSKCDGGHGGLEGKILQC